MSRIKKLVALAAVVSLAMFAIGNLPALAAERLENGDLESSAAPNFWELATSVTGLPESSIPSVVEHVDGADHYVAPGPPPPGLGLLLHPQVGNQGQYEGQDKRVNLVLEQTFGTAVAPATPGRTYKFTGDVFFQDGYSGIVNTLNPLFPKGDYNSDTVVDAADYTVWRNNFGLEIALPQEGTDVSEGIVDEEDYDFWRSQYGKVGRAAGVESPTETKFELTFLNSSNVPLGTTTVYDLRTDPTTLAWRTGTDIVQAMAPANTQKVRVRVSVLDMVDNCCALGQDVFFDNFKLTDSSFPTINRLANGDLNIAGAPAGWTPTEGPTVDQGAGPVTADTIAFSFRGNRLSDIPNPNPAPPFATLPTGQQGLWLRGYVNHTQYEPDIPSVFGDISQTVTGTPGAQYTFSAWSAWEEGYTGGPGTYLKMEFLNGLSVVGTQTLNLAAAGQVVDDNSGTNENGINVEFDDWRQFSIPNTLAPLGTTHVRVSVGATGMFFNDLVDWQAAWFDEMSLIETLPGGGGGMAVPEPGSMVLVGIAVALVGAGRRRGR